MATQGVMQWSKTAASNATADDAVNWAEGMAPSAVNNSARAEMASVAMWRDDVSGTLTTGGSSTAYTLTTNATFASASEMSGAMICFIPHTTSGAAPTLAVDGLTARQIRSSTGVNVGTGGLIAGTPYVATYIHASTEFILQGGSGAFGAVSVASMTSTGTVTASGFVVGANPTATPGKTPTVQQFTSGTAQTYTTPTGVTWIKVRVVGGGGGSGGTGSGGTGGTSSFNSITAIGGTGGSTTAGLSGGAGGQGGTGTATLRLPGGGGGRGTIAAGSNVPGGMGGTSVFGGAGNSETAPVANSGSGAGGAFSASGASAGGGGAGEYYELIIGSPAATYTYTVGAGGTAGTGGGVAGAAGRIYVEEFYN